MSGVIDEQGIQWEHCNICGDFERIDQLQYDPPSTSYPHGRDVCRKCWRLMDSPRSLARRKKRIKAKLDVSRARIANTLQPTICNHPTKLADLVYLFEEESPDTTRAYTFCSQQCAESWKHNKETSQ